MREEIWFNIPRQTLVTNTDKQTHTHTHTVTHTETLSHTLRLTHTHTNTHTTHNTNIQINTQTLKITQEIWTDIHVCDTTSTSNNIKTSLSGGHRCIISASGLHKLRHHWANHRASARAAAAVWSWGWGTLLLFHWQRWRNSSYWTQWGDKGEEKRYLLLICSILDDLGSIKSIKFISKLPIISWNFLNGFQKFNVLFNFLLLL